MTQMKRTPKAEATRLHLLETGMALVLGKGIAGLGLQEILTQAGVPKGSFYHYFPSKEAFGVAVLEHYVTLYAERLDALLAAPGMAAGQMAGQITGHDLLLRYFAAWITDPDDPSRPGWASGCLVVKLSAEVADLSEEMRRVLEAGVTRLIDRMAALIAQGRADGSLGPGADALALAQVLYQMWLGAALLAKLTRQDAPMRAALGATQTLLACKADAERI